MKIVIRSFFVVLFAVVSSLAVFGQDEPRIERELVDALKLVGSYSIYGGGYDEDKLTSAQAAFQEKLLKSTNSVAMLKYKFTELDELMSIATSADGKLRIYSWDMQDGGTMHRFARVYQYAAADGTIRSRADKAEEEGMGHGFVSDIYNVSTNEGALYIVCSTVIASGKNYMQSANLYTIDDAVLNDAVKRFKTGSGLTNKISFDYDNFSVIDREDRPEKLIVFDAKTGTLKFPVVINDQRYPDGRVTDKFIGYKFDGTYFVKIR